MLQTIYMMPPLIKISDFATASNVVQALNTRQQHPNYVGSIIGDCINFNVFFVV